MRVNYIFIPQMTIRALCWVVYLLELLCQIWLVRTLITVMQFGFKLVKTEL